MESGGGRGKPGWRRCLGDATVVHWGARSWRCVGSCHWLRRVVLFGWLAVAFLGCVVRLGRVVNAPASARVVGGHCQSFLARGLGRLRDRWMRPAALDCLRVGHLDRLANHRGDRCFFQCWCAVGQDACCLCGPLVGLERLARNLHSPPIV